MSSFDEKIKKFRRGKYDVEDLSNYLKKRVRAGASVVPLRERRWTKVGEYWIYLKDVHIGTDDSWIEVMIVKKVGLICKFIVDKPISVVEWGVIADTNLVFEMWFVGDSVNSVPLMVELTEKMEVEKS